MACAGDATQICGGGNRILIYEDPKWAEPSRALLAVEIASYMEAIRRFHALVLIFIKLIEDYVVVINKPRGLWPVAKDILGRLSKRVPPTASEVDQAWATALAATGGISKLTGAEGFGSH